MIHRAGAGDSYTFRRRCLRIYLPFRFPLALISDCRRAVHYQEEPRRDTARKRDIRTGKSYILARRAFACNQGLATGPTSRLSVNCGIAAQKSSAPELRCERGNHALRGENLISKYESPSHNNCDWLGRPLWITKGLYSKCSISGLGKPPCRNDHNFLWAFDILGKNQCPSQSTKCKPDVGVHHPRRAESACPWSAAFWSPTHFLPTLGHLLAIPVQ